MTKYDTCQAQKRRLGRSGENPYQMTNNTWTDLARQIKKTSL